MASIRKLPSGRYRVRWRDSSGREHGVTVQTSHAAHRLKRDIETEAERGMVRDPRLAKAPFRDVLAENLSSDLRLRPSTRALYEIEARQHVLPVIGDRPIGSLRPADLRRMYANLSNSGVGVATIEVCHRLVSRVLRQAVSDSVIPSSPAAHAAPPRAKRKPPRILDEGDRNELMSCFEFGPFDRYWLMVGFALETGARFGEIAALRVGRLKLATRPPRVEILEAVSEVAGHLSFGPTKTGALRSVDISDELARLLKDHARGRALDDLVFPSPGGGPLSRTRFAARVWRPATRAALFEGDEPTFHDLRHTSAALAIAAGAHPKAIQERLGHASIRTTLDIYGHLFPSVGASLAEQLGAIWGSDGGTYVARGDESSGAAVSGLGRTGA